MTVKTALCIVGAAFAYTLYKAYQSANLTSANIGTADVESAALPGTTQNNNGTAIVLPTGGVPPQ